MKILFVPDSLWGDASGHRSSKYLIKAFATVNIDIAVYAPMLGYTEQQHDVIKKYNCKFYPRREYNYSQQIFRKKVDEEFESIISDYSPDFVFYVGTIKNKTSIDFCIKNNIKYLYLALTTEYYCIKTFAGLETGPCYGCLQGSLTAPFSNNCLPSDYGISTYIKEKAIEVISRKRIINAYKVVGYSEDQLNILECFGVDRGKTLKLPIFFDPDSANGIDTSVGEQFLIFGQLLTAKGWHLIPEIIKRTQGVRYKAIVRKSVSDKFISDNKLEFYVESGVLEIVDFLETHDLLLNELAHSKGVLIPSYYPTTGEFTMIESLMLGKPVVVFDAGIHREIFTDKKNGMIAKVGDLKGYCEKIEELNNDQELHGRVSAGGKELFAQITSLDRFRTEIRELQ